MALDTLLNLPDDQRKAALEAQHPLHKDRAEAWQQSLDAYEGGGGFADGGELWKYRAELPEDFQERQQQARYHNFCEAIVDLYVRHLFSEGVSRTVDGPDAETLKAWWDDTDGAGTRVDDLMRRLCAFGLASGHCGVLVDKTPDAPTGPSVEDEQAQVVAVVYPAPSIVDWRFARHALSGLKMKEAAPQGSIAEPPADGEAFQWLLWDTEAFARFDQDGEPITPEGDGAKAITAHGLGLVPFATFRSKPSTVDPLVGRPLCGDPNILAAIYNRCSEEDEILRGQTFSVLHCQMPPESSQADIDSTSVTLGANYGVKRGLVTKGVLGYVSSDVSQPKTVRENIEYLIRAIFRASHVPFDQDSRVAESAESIALQHRELNEMLQGVASSLTEVERAIVRFWCGWMSTTPEEAERRYEALDLQIAYPREFFTGSLVEDINALAQAMRLSRSETFKRHVEKKLVRRVDPELTQDADLLTTIEGEIDSQPGMPSPAEQAQALRDSAAARLKGLAQERAA